MAGHASRPRERCRGSTWYLNAPVLQALAAFQQGSSQLLFPEPCSLKFLSVEEGLKLGDELVACEHEGASAAAAELVGAELGHEFVGLASLNLENLFDDGAIDDRGGKTLDLGRQCRVGGEAR